MRSEHSNTQVDKTKQQECELETKKAHRRRLNAMMMFFESEHLTCFAAGTRALSADDIKNEMLFHCPEQRSFTGPDLVCRGVNAGMVLAFLAANEKKENGKA